jgi:hypothetical protein
MTVVAGLVVSILGPWVVAFAILPLSVTSLP